MVSIAKLYVLNEAKDRPEQSVFDGFPGAYDEARDAFDDQKSPVAFDDLEFSVTPGGTLYAEPRDKNKIDSPPSYFWVSSPAMWMPWRSTEAGDLDQARKKWER